MGSLVVAGAVLLAPAFGAAGAAAAAQPGDAPVVQGLGAAPDGVAGTDRGADAPHTHVSRNSATGVRAIPDPAPLAAVDAGRLHVPNPAEVATVAPIEAPAGKLRFGDTQVDIPAWLPPEPAAQINDASAQVEARLAGTLDSAGFAPSRSDRIAAQTLGTAAQGAAVGTAVASPLVVAGVVMGGFVGAMAGTPMLPVGTVVPLMIGAGMGGALVATPAAAVGAAIGAAAGAVNGITAPPVGDPAEAPANSGTVAGSNLS
ncbi:hypothetical protein IU500_09075 [Nocardia terpenica]|uniref:hypothetical protein n=1 Tax=Nocardia terpenica TaxID=455432 RepID=UPI0018951EB7|nr:hypothetical protein [Nocardia terpenica]MBF6062103.1 hypothetical protein [Nocardia terpenica]MBF6104191.1 hypothetical protein [Nocardia terpenica]MBF6109953.1 hypothetical protein [Nocardia terpenica]MBF6120259.1 hypothetical protein [Nocardia terpenica]MBF6152670.1 hypothetical protein [Nocardia terpenica]